MSRLEKLIAELCPDGVEFYPLGQGMPLPVAGLDQLDGAGRAWTLHVKERVFP